MKKIKMMWLWIISIRIIHKHNKIVKEETAIVDRSLYISNLGRQYGSHNPIQTQLKLQKLLTTKPSSPKKTK